MDSKIKRECLMIGCRSKALRNSKKCIKCVRYKPKAYKPMQQAYNSGPTITNPWTITFNSTGAASTATTATVTTGTNIITTGSTTMSGNWIRFK